MFDIARIKISVFAKCNVLIDTKRKIFGTNIHVNPWFPVEFPFNARQTPPEGGATCFADTVSALAALPEEKQEKLKNLEWEDPDLWISMDLSMCVF